MREEQTKNAVPTPKAGNGNAAHLRGRDAVHPPGIWGLLKVWGPAWLVMIADVDAASVITAAESGAMYGTKLVWFLVALVVPLYVIQEVAGRVGAVTGRGLGELIHENYSRRSALLAAVPMALVDVISYVVEYTGAAIGFQIVGIPPQVSVPLVFIAHILLVYKRKYAEAEKPLLVISVLFAVAWAISAFLNARHGFEFTPFYVSTSPDFFFLLTANVGAVIMPFMLFYQASATAEKKIGASHLWAIRLETAIGAVVSELIMIAIAVAAIGVSKDSLNFAAPGVLSEGLASVAGKYAPYVFSAGLIAASFIALIVISLGSSWGVTEALGWGRNNWFKLYIIESIPALVIPMFTLNLVNLALNLMVLQIVVLMGPAVILGLISANKRLMGQYALRGFNKMVYWVLLALVFATGVIGVIQLI
ncbi:MAG TPA: divalent metal cation transporter [Bacteroidota bacterium]|nr:divalent metal cation transporter [Bacteroidota bacterium]